MLFFETSAKTGDNIDTCFVALTAEINKKVLQNEVDITNEALGIKILKKQEEHPPSEDNCQC